MAPVNPKEGFLNVDALGLAEETAELDRRNRALEGIHTLYSRFIQRTDRVCGVDPEARIWRPEELDLNAQDIDSFIVIIEIDGGRGLDRYKMPVICRSFGKEGRKIVMPTSDGCAHVIDDLAVYRNGTIKEGAKLRVVSEKTVVEGRHYLTEGLTAQSFSGSEHKNHLPLDGEFYDVVVWGGGRVKRMKGIVSPIERWMASGHLDYERRCLEETLALAKILVTGVPLP